MFVDLLSLGMYERLSQAPCRPAPPALHTLPGGFFTPMPPHPTQSLELVGSLVLPS